VLGARFPLYGADFAEEAAKIDELAWSKRVVSGDRPQDLSRRAGVDSATPWAGGGSA
jgi:hypothetical protein